MKKIIAIGGPPGSGKSTLMKHLMNKIVMNNTYYDKDRVSDIWFFYDDVKLVTYYKNCKNIYILGHYPEGEVFGGTDKLSMAVQPEAVKFIDSLPDDSVVLFEGDRLFNNSFLDYCSKFDLKIIILNTSKEEKQRRYKERGSTQNEKWLQGRETKVNTIASNFDLMDKIESFNHDVKEDTETIAKHIMDLINE